MSSGAPCPGAFVVRQETYVDRRCAAVNGAT